MLAHTGMLSWSASATRTPVDLEAVTNPLIDPVIPGGHLLLHFTDAALSRAPDRHAAGDEVARSLGPAALVNAASVVANFQMMNRVADATGMPVGRRSRLRNAELIARLGLDRFDHDDTGNAP